MNKEAKSNLILGIALAVASIFSFIRGKMFLGISGAVLAVLFIMLFFTNKKN